MGSVLSLPHFTSLTLFECFLGSCPKQTTFTGFIVSRLASRGVQLPNQGFESLIPLLMQAEVVFMCLIHLARLVSTKAGNIRILGEEGFPGCFLSCPALQPSSGAHGSLPRSSPPSNRQSGCNSRYHRAQVRAPCRLSAWTPSHLSTLNMLQFMQQVFFQIPFKRG